MTKLFVIPGHGAGDPGAGGGGYNEAERVRALATRMKQLAPNEVTLADFNRNYYADNGVSSLSLPKDTCVIELHMDSSDSPSAKGGHVIIKSGYVPDYYDRKLAENIKAIFPGRSEIIVGRGNLANINRAAIRGLNYRLLEVCFISNAQDLQKFNREIDGVARAILAAFDIAEGDDIVTEDQMQRIAELAAEKVWSRILENPVTHATQSAAAFLTWGAANTTTIKTEIMNVVDPTGMDLKETPLRRIPWMEAKQEKGLALLEQIAETVGAEPTEATKK